MSRMVASGFDQINAITSDVISSAIKVHKRVGPGVYEAIYKRLIAHELVKLGRIVELEKPVRLEYDGLEFDEIYRLDMVVDRTVLVELKAIESLLPVHEAQILSYLFLTGLPVGLLMNLRAPTIREGLSRYVNRGFRVPAQTPGPAPSP